MKKIFGNIGSRRLAVMGGVLVLAGASLAFGRLAGAKEHAKATSDAKTPPVRLVVSDSPVSREGRTITSFAPVVKKVAPSVVKVFVTSKGKQISMTQIGRAHV